VNVFTVRPCTGDPASSLVEETAMATNKRILVVDDDKDLSSSVEAFLKARGHDVTVANSGAEARDLLTKMTPDAIVLDIMMETDAEGFHLAYKIKNEEATRKIPVVVLSGFMNHFSEKVQNFEFIQGLDWPAARFFEKPVALKELADAVVELIAERESRDALLAAAEA
jgi:DNA-binding response OmpR family regulator